MIKAGFQPPRKLFAGAGQMKCRFDANPAGRRHCDLHPSPRYLLRARVVLRSAYERKSSLTTRADSGGYWREKSEHLLMIILTAWWTTSVCTRLGRETLASMVTYVPPPPICLSMMKRAMETKSDIGVGVNQTCLDCATMQVWTVLYDKGDFPDSVRSSDSPNRSSLMRPIALQLGPPARRSARPRKDHSIPPS